MRTVTSVPLAALAVLALTGCLEDATELLGPHDAVPLFHHRPGHAGGPGGGGDDDPAPSDERSHWETGWIFALELEGMPAGILNDGLGAPQGQEGSWPWPDGAYVHGDCDTAAFINAEQSENGDAMLRLGGLRLHPRDRRACEQEDPPRTERRFTVVVGELTPAEGFEEYFDPSLENSEFRTGFMNLDDFEGVTLELHGEANPFETNIVINGDCLIRGGPRWNDQWGGNLTDPVRVVPLEEDNELAGWLAISQGEHRVACAQFSDRDSDHGGGLVPTGIFSLPFQVEVRFTDHPPGTE